MKHLRTQSAVEVTEDIEQVQAESGSRFKRRPLWVIFAIVLLSVSVIFGALLFSRRLPGQAAESDGNQKLQRMGPIHSFEPFIVNIAGSNATRYLRVCVNVECSSKKVHAKIIENELRIRDRILDLLCAQSMEELLDVSGRDDLRVQMAMTIREALGNTEDDSEWVKSVYFSEFTIQ